ncbi:class I SAM-dependent DNA methyltransferase [Actinacidiphila acididurans]|uniref:site-specific DNA-methyltransferase (adenine-specific) n=1 Tax=Actinacidiphila acididurans TaxID=2784346 RepID=A0ABS2TRM4_9ACTN|nr:DNA methyltransferase [Actinacidiphila acididurans]MBM9505462.1 class I SAM-dependent DNA methyltransferase [Actinacidiphila acididurans]
MVTRGSETLRAQLDAFVRYRKEHLTGDEKGEAQVFLDRLFRAFGHDGVREAGATLEMRIKKRNQRGTAFADLMWKPRCLIEMKKVGTNLKRHYRQAFDYWVQAVPDRPRYVMLSNFDEFWIYDFDQQLDEPVDRVALEDLPQRSDAFAFLLPYEERPIFRNDLVAVTREAATDVARVFKQIHARGIPRIKAQLFTLQSVMAMFAEDIGMLPSHSFSRALDDSTTGSDAYDLLFGLFREMNTPGTTPAGRYKGTPYFNGGLFAEVYPVELTNDELNDLRHACETDWSEVRPEIFGTLFEGSMDEGERHAQGAHFTSQADIAKIVGPTIVNPWREKIGAASTISELENLLIELSHYRVLDPACGSGNFLYVAYRELRRIEHEIATLVTERRRGRHAGQQTISYVPTDHFFGIDVNPFAVEVAKVTMMLAKKLSTVELDDHQEVLPLDNLDNVIIAADALFCEWPQADAIIGNPPYLGRRKMVAELGAEYCQRLLREYPNVAGVSDFVTYWFPLAHDHLPQGGRAGMVATKTIRENDSRKSSLDYISDNNGTIFEAVSSQPWSGDAVVHVSLVNWAKGIDVSPKVLWLNDGQLRLEVEEISPTLRPGFDVRKACDLEANAKPQVCFQGQTPGVTKGFVIDRATRHVLTRDEKARDVIHPFLGGREMLRDTSIERWIIDIQDADLLSAESRYPGLMQHLASSVLQEREKAAAKEKERNGKAINVNPKAKVNKHHANFLAKWWNLSYRRNDMLEAVLPLDRYLATSRVASVNRPTVFTFVDSRIHPSDSMTVFALDDDYSFGVLSSEFHSAWVRARCSYLKGDPRYTSTTVWESFPWPQSPTPAKVRGVANAAAELLRLRQKYLDRGIPLERQYASLLRPGQNELKKLHDQLTEAVRKAYGFTKSDDYLDQLFALNKNLAETADGVWGPGARGFDGARSTDYRILPPVG